MSESVPDRFERWMATKGIMESITQANGVQITVPSSPMSPKTVRGYMRYFHKVMTTLGHLTRKEHSTWMVSPGTDWTEIPVKEFEQYVYGKYGDLDNIAISTRNNVCKMIKKFGQFMFYEYRPRGKSGWSESKLNKIYNITRVIRVQQESLRINSPRKAHAFARWLMDQDDPLKKVYGEMIWTGEWLGLRYEELVQIPKDLDGRTFRIDWDTRWATIWGKGRHGKKNRPIPISENMVQFLSTIQEKRSQLDVESDRMFISPQTNRPYNPDDPSTFNKILKKFAVEFNDQLSTKKLRLDVPLVKSHVLMRHVFGTHYGSRLTAEDLMEYMGITQYDVVKRYINYSDREKIDRFDRVNGMTGSSHPKPVAVPQSNGDSVGDVLDVLSEKATELFPDDEGRQIAWKQLIAGLKGMAQ